MSNWLGRSNDNMNRDLRDFMEVAIIEKMRKNGVKSLGKNWLRKMSDEELNKKYDEFINSIQNEVVLIDEVCISKEV